MDAALPLHHSEPHWLPVWATSCQPPSPAGLSRVAVRNQTVRMIVHPHLGGHRLRIRLSNRFGETPLVVDAVTVGKSMGTGSVEAVSLCSVTFAGHAKVVVCPGANVVSGTAGIDPAFGVDLAVSIYLQVPTGPVTRHSWAAQTGYLAFGDHAGDPGAQWLDATIIAWLWLDEIDTLAPEEVEGSIVAIGDSITDAGHSTPDTNRRWPDYLARRLAAAHTPPRFSVVNCGISGNHVLRAWPDGGLAMVDRFADDVVHRLGVVEVICLGGINDIAYETGNSAASVTGGLAALVRKAHAAGLAIHGGTLTPFEGHVNYSREREHARGAVNSWIRTDAGYDSVIDFDVALRDPQNPHRMGAAWHAGDWLHPGDAGLERMAQVIDLASLDSCLSSRRRWTCQYDTQPN